MVSGKKALAMAGLDKEANASAFSQLDLTRCGVLVGSGMGGLSVFQDGELPVCQQAGHKQVRELRSFAKPTVNISLVTCACVSPCSKVTFHAFVRHAVNFAPLQV
jgi:3-oxoacyl-(acyl-carrier-protein) synthase